MKERTDRPIRGYRRCLGVSVRDLIKRVLYHHFVGAGERTTGNVRPIRNGYTIELDSVGRPQSPEIAGDLDVLNSDFTVKRPRSFGRDRGCQGGVGVDKPEHTVHKSVGACKQDTNLGQEDNSADN